MKKLLLVAAVAVFGLSNAQFKAGAHVGLPIGDSGDETSVNFGVDVAYTWRVAEKFDLGVTTGYTQYAWKSDIKDAFKAAGLDLPTAGFIPIAATAKYDINGGFFVGADLGYAITTMKDGEGGFLYQPKVGYTFQGKHDLYLAYKGISQDGGTVGSVNLGYAYTFAK